jgi:hypothetical protein
MSKVVAGVVGGLLVLVLAVAVVGRGWKIWESTDSSLSGDVVLKKLEAKDELRVASGQFDVPVVVCNDTAVPFVEGKSDQGDTIGTFCRGPGAESSTLLVPGKVDAVVPVRAIKISKDPNDASRVTVQVPQPTLQTPVIESKNIVELAYSTSWIPNTDLARDYEQKASAQAEKAISKVALKSGILDLARSSAESQLKDLLGLAFDKVDVVFVTAPTAGN